MAATDTSPATETLRVNRTLAAPPEEVIRAWTKPEALKLRFAPSPEHRVEMKSPEGPVHTVAEGRSSS